MRGSSVLIGDFNFPGIRWGSGRSDAKSRPFFDAIEDNFLAQHVDEPTHKSGNILDLVISKDEHLVENVEHEGRLGKSDHEMLLVALNLEMIEAVVPTNSRDYGKANFEEMRRELRDESWECISHTGVEECWSILRGRLKKLVDDWVPWKRKGMNTPRWMNGEIRKAVNEKKRAWNKWKRTGREEEKKEYLMWEKKTKKLIRNRKNALERQVARDSKHNPKSFYSYINSSRRNRDSIGPLKINDKLVMEPTPKAEALNEYFSSVFTRCDTVSPTKEPLTGIGTIENVDITTECIKEEIGRLRKFAAPGPDNVTNGLLIATCDEIAKPLAILFNKSLEHAKIPDDWRLSNVSPIYKQRDRNRNPEIIGLLA